MCIFVSISFSQTKKVFKGRPGFHGSSGALAREVEENITAVVSLKDSAVHFNKQL